MKSFRELVVWQKSMLLVKEIYKIIDRIPNNENYALTPQIQRSAISIPSNIAEGYGRNSTKDYLRFLNIARGSLYELETQLEIAEMLHYFTKNDTKQCISIISEIGKMLNSLIKNINNN